MIINKIIGGGGSSMSPAIVVTAPSGSTVKLDGVTGTEVSGTWTFATTIGSHTISATYNGVTKTQSVTVDAVAVYSVEILFTVTLTTSNFSTYFTASNSTYYFSGNGSTWTSTNYNVNSSTATSTWTAKSDMSVSIDWCVSSESGYDKFTMTVAGTTKVNAVSGEQSGTVTASLSAGQTIVLTYSKDGSAKSGSDTAYVTNIVIRSASPIKSELICSTANTLLVTINYYYGDRNYYKTNSGDAICAFGGVYNSPSNLTYYCPIIVSTSSSAVTYNINGNTYTYDGSITYDGVTYYYNKNSYSVQNDNFDTYTGNYTFNINTYTGKTYTSKADMALDLVKYYFGAI